MAALLPRLYALGTYLTIDEVKWAEGTAQFLLALRSGDLAQTYWHFHPGITIVWGGALTLWIKCGSASDLAQCVLTQVENLAEVIGWLRLVPVLFTALGISGVYLLGRKLLEEKVALLAALLLAFDPFFIAHSRILNGDAVAAIFMFLSLLAFLIYWLNQSANDAPNFASPSLLSLILSGVLAGLAVLTKLPAPLMGLFIGGLGLVAMASAWRQQGGLAVRRWLGALALWGGVALLVVVLLWPALWVAPLETLRQMYLDSFQVGGAGEGHDAFFLGQTLNDPGPWFYPYVIAFRMTPVVMVGVLLLISWLLVRFRAQPRFGPIYDWRLTLWIILAFVIFIIIFSSISPKKLDRYVMAVIPALVFLAAAGLARIGQWVNFSPAALSRRASIWSLLPITGSVALQLAFAILAAPYYLTYYNPLLGGPPLAAAQVPVGWGEGLEQAARYLNGLPNAESLAVSSWYSDIFDPYFIGQRASFADDGRAQLAADYVVFYINQIQRQKPYVGLINYFRARQPVFVVKVGPMGQVTNEQGISWVEVYQAPAAQSASGAPKIEGVAQLLAYKVSGRRIAGSKVADEASALLSNDEVLVTLFLRVLGPLPEGTTFHVALDPLSPPNLGVWQPAPLKSEWVEGAVVEWPGRLTLPAEMPAGDYKLSVTLQALENSPIAQFAISDKDTPITVK